jgi:hypothetical protein
LRFHIRRYGIAAGYFFHLFKHIDDMLIMAIKAKVRVVRVVVNNMPLRNMSL